MPEGADAYVIAQLATHAIILAWFASWVLDAEADG